MAGNSKSKHLLLSLSVLLGRRLVLLVLAVEAAFGAALQGRSGRPRRARRPDGDLAGQGDRRRGRVRGLRIRWRDGRCESALSSQPKSSLFKSDYQTHLPKLTMEKSKFTWLKSKLKQNVNLTCSVSAAVWNMLPVAIPTPMTPARAPPP